MKVDDLYLEHFVILMLMISFITVRMKMLQNTSIGNLIQENEQLNTYANIGIQSPEFPVNGSSSELLIKRPFV